MSELILFKWDKDKDIRYVNSVRKNTLVFIYGKSTANAANYLEGYDLPNEDFIKRMLGLDEEEQFYEDTQGYLEGIGKKNDKSITSLRIKEITDLNNEIVEFILKNLHKLYWRDFTTGVISTINPNKALDLIIPAAVEFRKVLIESVDKKYNRGLSVANVKNIKENHDLDTRQRLGENIPNIGKNKKK